MVRRDRSRPRSWFVMSVCDGVFLCPNALVVKAFQRVMMAADCRERSNRSWCCEIAGLGMYGGGCDCVPFAYIKWIVSHIDCAI